MEEELIIAQSVKNNTLDYYNNSINDFVKIVKKVKMLSYNAYDTKIK